MAILIANGKIKKDENDKPITEADRFAVCQRLYLQSNTLQALYNLGLMHSFDPNKYDKACEYFSRAVEGGFLEAKIPLDLLKEEMQALKAASPAAATIAEPLVGGAPALAGSMASAAGAAGAAPAEVRTAGVVVSAAATGEAVAAARDDKRAHLAPAAAADAGAEAKPVEKLSDDASSDDEKEGDVKGQQSFQDDKKEDRLHGEEKKRKRQAYKKKLQERERIFKKALVRLETLNVQEKEQLYATNDSVKQTKIKWEKNSFNEFMTLPSRQTRKIQLLINAIREDDRYGAPECLKGDLKDRMSRRIDKENRLVYRYDQNENTIVIYSCKGHY